MRRRFLPILLLLCFILPTALPRTLAQENGLLIHWRFDEGRGTSTRDYSGNGLRGEVGARWRKKAPSGSALYFNGRSDSVVRVVLPEDRRFGTGSWTFSAWLKPRQFSINAELKHRRIFSFGEYPAATLVINILEDGRPSCYLCYQDQQGKNIDTGATGAAPLRIDEWAYLVLVVDRENGTMEFFLNALGGAPAAIPPGFAGDFLLNGTLTVGSSWQNYIGEMDEVKIYRRALSAAEVRAEFESLQEVFGVSLPWQITANEGLKQVNAAWAAGNFPAVQEICRDLANRSNLPGHYRSYVMLRLAQSYMVEENFPAALGVYEEIVANDEYPAIHRDEAREFCDEIRNRLGETPGYDREAGRTGAHKTPITLIDSFAVEIHVAPDGDDQQGDGSAANPFATLARARDEARRAKTGDGPVGILLAPGEYPLSASLVLDAGDSGFEGAPVVFRAKEKGKAVLYGGTRLSGFTPVTNPAILQRLPAEARGKVYQCDLKQLGIYDYGKLQTRGFNQPPSPPTLELYCNGEPMTLARWPNRGFVSPRELVDPGAKGRPAVLRYEADRHERWVNAPDGWLFGYFHYLWADSTIKIGAIDPGEKTLTTATPYRYSHELQSMDNEQGIIYYAFNLLEEIDIPGEWYLDRTSGILYFYPPSDPEAAVIEISMLSEPLVLMENLSHLRFEGVVFDLARWDGIQINNCRDVLLAGCVIRRIAGRGVVIHGGRANGIFGCEIHTIGRSATEIYGGDRKTLTPGRHFIENCHLHHFGRIDRTYTPAVLLVGVGNRIAHNLMHDGPSSVMRIGGNDHLIEFNEAYNAVTESDDQGAVDMWGNPAYRGNTFRYNYFHHIGRTGDEHFVWGQAGLRLDDTISGQIIYGNVFAHCSRGVFGGVQIHAGRDNIFDNNIFYACNTGVSGGWSPHNYIWQGLKDGTHHLAKNDYHNTQLYLSRYPEIKYMLDDNGRNYLWRNLFYACGEMLSERSNRQVFDLIANTEFLAGEDPGFAGGLAVFAASGTGSATGATADGAGSSPGAESSLPARLFRLRPDAPLFRSVAFRPLPVEEIGLYEHELQVCKCANATDRVSSGDRQVHRE
ncbi:MAG TPA: hypothetical protein GXZ26_04725 [Firmicutes bacterium]|jgi:hypothetical protein|nr:hypothetical protein [Bacillota bacterium]